jgi:hypothetical protein
MVERKRNVDCLGALACSQPEYMYKPRAFFDSFHDCESTRLDFYRGPQVLKVFVPPFQTRYVEYGLGFSVC